MLVELLGLPGSGKSTLVKTLLEKSSDHAINIETLNQRAERVLQHHKRKRGYIRRKRGRGWFFATFEFAHCYPEIFRIVFENAILQQDRNLDFFDLLAQYHFSKQATDAVGPALSDEGFLHRGSAIFLYPNTYSNIDTYLKHVPCFDTVIHIGCSIDLAIERCKSRPKGLPKRYRSFSEQELSQCYQKLERLHQTCLGHHKDRGGNIIRVDGQKPWAQTTQTILGILSDDGAIGAVPFDIEV